MIIVSQDRKQIINFENVTGITIYEDEEEKKWFIGCSTNSAESMSYDLGYYKTEERAKEVFDFLSNCICMQSHKIEMPEE